MEIIRFCLQMLFGVVVGATVVAGLSGWGESEKAPEPLTVLECRGSAAPVWAGTILRNCRCEVKRGIWKVGGGPVFDMSNDRHWVDGLKEEDGAVCMGCFAGTRWECPETQVPPVAPDLSEYLYLE